ncbi:unnamed protein product [Ostreobium quekettii]|uniref:PPM-type phosphatase domain-containing protein n=1 Tax=Ostreobium quekettii TaxID=121088 RepID=A0A8S1JBU4_9CHLO|nr:unnamed protein product [Ostreobium quekettii]
MDGACLRGGAGGDWREGGTSTSAREPLTIKYSTSQKSLKEEDVIFAREGVTFAKGGPSWSMYCVCDGHTGVTAAHYVRDALCPVLGALLPDTPLPPYGSKEFESFTYDVGTALVEAFVRIGQNFTEDNPNDVSGCTVTVALLCGRLLTVANVGDSDAVVDTGTDAFLATACHRIEDNAGERERLTSQGVRLGRLSPSLTHVAAPGEKGVGPLRCWPGGLAVSRSIGDAEAGVHVLTCPNVCQVVLPRSGARVLMGSDGLWDLIAWDDAVRLIRRTPASKAASRVLTQALFQHNWCFTDDTSALVLDVLPAHRGDFPSLVKEKLKRQRKRQGADEGCGGFSACFCGVPKARALDVGACEEDQHEVLAAIDGWELLRDAQELSPNDSCSSLTEMTRQAQRELPAADVKLRTGLGGGGGREHTPSLNGAWRKLTGGAYANEVVESEHKEAERRRPEAVLDPVDKLQQSSEWLMSFASSHTRSDAVDAVEVDTSSKGDEASLRHWMRMQRSGERPPRPHGASRRG